MQKVPPPPGSILLYRNAGGRMGMSLSSISHVGFQLPDNHVYHLVFPGTRLHQKSRIEPNIYELEGYIEPKNKHLKRKIVETCMFLQENPEAVSYLSARCPRQIGSLLNPFGSCLQNPSIRLREKNHNIIHNFIQILNGRSHKRQVKVCSTFVFLILAVSISRLKTQQQKISSTGQQLNSVISSQQQVVYQSLLSRLNIDRCHPKDVLVLPQEFSDWFSLVLVS